MKRKQVCGGIEMDLQELYNKHKRIVFFGGAGVSTESGIPDYRSKNGIYKQGFKLPAETMLSHSYFFSHTDDFYSFYRKVMVHPEAEPNDAHIKLAEMEKTKLISVITQNIDGLHQKAGSQKVRELHGSIYRNHCIQCGKAYGLDAILETDGIPRCSCGGIIKPDVVLYEESLDYDVLTNAVDDIFQADMMIVGGTSLNVYPAAGLLQYFHGDCVVIINLQPTQYDRMATLTIERPIGEVFRELEL